MFEGTQPAPISNNIRNQGDGRWYAPNRDVAYLGPELIREALRLFNTRPVENPTYAALLESELGDPQYIALGEFAKQIALLTRGAITDDDTIDVIYAKLAAAAAPVSPAVRVAFMARLGEMLLGAMFGGLRDITPAGGQPPNMRSIEAMVKEASALCDKITAAPVGG